ncbi:murein tripeptide ABC transporter/oligopeptide ABC transporter ATP binding subunit OppF [Hyphomicrobiales bacterium]|nr:murein tripeptide ABC transporter/oligopeptide ABC transporter ATP binding subunit OppF [Hyphomicrobiales bacterium]CAH1694112.1 murein tripeptide ABC transporter/oligopeptide ABC transporter ATP binding subunit OppF [Hyphomicrobiales bacterium]
MTLVEVRDLHKQFVLKGGIFGKVARVNAVNAVNLSVEQGEVLALVGESGSGKSTLGRLVARLDTPTAGDILYNGNNVARLNARQLFAFRRQVQMIFQDPFASLNPHMRVRDMLAEPLHIHGLARGRDGVNARIDQLMGAVGLSSTLASRFPHEFSGGQRQRLSIARALAVEPEFIVADEAVSALDVSTQAQVVNLLSDLKRELKLTVLFISHNLAIVQNVADRVAVLYLGRILEVAPTADLFQQARHPYTQALLGAIPIPDPTARRKRIVLQGEIPSPMRPPSGCVFRTRCPHALPDCAAAVPPLRSVGTGRLAACIRDDLVSASAPQGIATTTSLRALS